MKRVIVAISSILIVIVAANLHSSRAQDAIQASASEPAADGSAPPTQNWAGGNPLKIALLKWFPAYHSTSFKVGKSPIGLAFDGENIWVSNQYGQSLTKLRANDGENLGTFTVGSGPTGVAFDGANIWTANEFDDTVTKLRASDGKNQGTFAVGKTPQFLAFDGEAIWVTNSEGASITKVRASDGKVLGTFQDSGGYPSGITFDGTYMWAANSNPNLKGTVTRFKPDGTSAGTFNVGGAPLLMAFDGANIWVTNTVGGGVTKLRANDGKILGTFNAGCCPYGIAFDGVNVWVVGSPYLVVLRASDGKLIYTTHDVQGGGAGIAFDGGNIWEAAYAVNQVSKR